MIFSLLRKYSPICGLAASASTANYFYNKKNYLDENESKQYSPLPYLFATGQMASASSNSTAPRDALNAGISALRKQDNDNAEPPTRPDLPVYKMEEIKNMALKTLIPGFGSLLNRFPSRRRKILLAAGGSVEPFWAIYAQHNTKEVMEILETLRIGNLDLEDLKASLEQRKDASDPFSTDPIRHPALLVNSEKPFNAETPPSLLIDEFKTPNQLFFVRNHMPVPQTDAATHQLNVEGLGITKPVHLSVQQLKQQYEPVSITSVVQCAGNRRNDMNAFKKVQGLMWTGTAISNAKWTGVRLRDVLMVAGVDPHDKHIKHVHFEGADSDPTGTHYGASIPFDKAMSPETIIAYQVSTFSHQKR